MENNERDTKPSIGAPKFNNYWIYGAIALVLIGFNLYNFSGVAQETLDPLKLKQMVLDGDVKKVVVVNSQVAEIYLKEDRIKKYPNAAPMGKFQQASRPPVVSSP